MSKIYDCIIVGAGVIGSFVARNLSKYEGNFLVLEKNNDVGDVTTNANSAIVHSGYDPKPGTKKAYFNVKGNKMMEQVCKELDCDFIKNGSLTIGFNDEDLKTLLGLLERAKENGVDGKIIDSKELHEMEPNLNEECKFALYCKDSGIVNPFRLCVGAMENAMDNGVELKLNSKVIDIKKKDDLYVIKTEKEEFLSKAVVNASGVYGKDILSLVEENDLTITPRKGEYVLLNHFNDNWVKRTLFMCPTKVGKGVLISPTTSFNYIIGPSNEVSTKEDTATDPITINAVKESAKKLIKDLPLENAIRYFAGVRANPASDDFLIEESKNNPLFFNCVGIMSPGLASSPAIGEYVGSLIKDRLNLKINESFNPYIKKHHSLKHSSNDEFNKLIKENPKYGHLVCRCEKVSEAEIVDCINRNCGATTVKGVKKRVRSGFGMCQGTFCQEEVCRILARELHKDIKDIKYSNDGSNVLKFPSKGE